MLTVLSDLEPHTGLSLGGTHVIFYPLAQPEHLVNCETVVNTFNNSEYLRLKFHILSYYINVCSKEKFGDTSVLWVFMLSLVEFF